MAYNFDKLYINGHWCDSTSGQFIEVAGNLLRLKILQR